MQSLTAYDSPPSSPSPSSSPRPDLPTPDLAPQVVSAALSLPEPTSLLPTPPQVRPLGPCAARTVHIDPAAFDAGLNAFRAPTPKRARLTESRDAAKTLLVLSGPAKRARGKTAPVSSTVVVPHTKEYGKRDAWFAAPKGRRTFADLEVYSAYVPKRSVWTAGDVHGGKGVNRVRWSPGCGHLMASCGLDGGVKVWRETGSGGGKVDGGLQLARGYFGHGQGVKDVVWSADGRWILSGGWDKKVLLWDVETGRVAGSFGAGGVVNCLLFNPEDDNGFLMGCGDKKVMQMDVRDGNGVVQTYDHLGAVNSMAFVDDNRRFVSSSDDKVIRVWDVGIPICLKYISDPAMHSCPVTVLHPNGKSIACQSLDNTVRVYSVRDRFRMNNRKKFEGHLVAGYAAGISFSPDGRFLASGDSMGRTFFWDWKTSHMVRAMQGHKGVCMDVDWHPTSPSRVVSCSWGGDIKVWD